MIMDIKSTFDIEKWPVIKLLCNDIIELFYSSKKVRDVIDQELKRYRFSENSFSQTYFKQVEL